MSLLKKDKANNLTPLEITLSSDDKNDIIKGVDLACIINLWVIKEYFSENH